MTSRGADAVFLHPPVMPLPRFNQCRTLELSNHARLAGTSEIGHTMNLTAAESGALKPAAGNLNFGDHSPTFERTCGTTEQSPVKTTSGLQGMSSFQIALDRAQKNKSVQSTAERVVIGSKIRQ